ncbi:MAG: hypothetical protein ACRDZU_04300 [Acidimicrobiales bacterium]
MFRRTKRTALAVGAVVAITVVAMDPGAAAPSAPAQEAFNKGTGTAQANSMQVDPVAGGLSFGIGIGQSLAGHQNTVGQSESRAFDLGVIGVTLAGQGCDGGDPTLPADSQPQPEQISSTDEGSEQGHKSTESFAGGQISKEVRASDDPMAEALTITAPFDIPGLIRVGASRAYARSRVLATGVREATAVSEISDLSLIADAVTIKGLRWEAIHRTGAVNETIGTFTVEALEVAGAPVPVEDLSQINAVLEPLGFRLRAPRTRVVETSGGTIVIVDPLALAVVPNANRDMLLGGVLGALQPVREPLFDALIDFDCGNATYITIADVVISSITGGGTLSVSLGGVRASTAALKLFEGLGQLTPLPPLPPLPLAPPTAGLPGRPAIPGTPGTKVAAPTTPEAPDSGPIETIGDTTGDRGGAMAMVGAGGLLLLAAVAEGDRRKMRSAQRAIPMEV